jgi:DNA-binding response OmpR family regulator
MIRDREDTGLPVAAKETGTVDVDGVMRDGRRQFHANFLSQCDRLMALAPKIPDDSASLDEAKTLLHRLAGLGGTLGFHRVSIEAARIEDQLRTSPADTSALKRMGATLHAALVDDLAQPTSDRPSPSSSWTGRPMTILLIEDEPVQRAILTAQLRQAGHRPVSLASGEHAIQSARLARPDVILLDVEMPGVDGHEVCRMLKADAALATIPIAFLSAHSDADDRLAGLSFGADDFLTKPVDPRELALRLQLLSKRRASAEDRTTPQVLAYEDFCPAAIKQLAAHGAALGLIRMAPERLADAAILLRDEVRHRDLCGRYDSSHLVVLLPQVGAGAARDRLTSVVEKCRAHDMAGVFAGVAASPCAGGRSLEDLLEEADEALAAARDEDVPAALRPETPSAVKTEALAPLVVVGDDDPDVVRILDAHLAASGFRRVLAFDGARALQEVRAHQPIVLVLDLMMPRMSGFDVLTGLKELGDARPRVIVLSARGREDDVIRAFSLGADDFMTKPFNPQELVARIARLVR